MIKRLSKILIKGLFALVLALGTFSVTNTTEVNAVSSVPSGYTRVDYIQATAGASYIDTGVSTNLSHKYTYSGMVSSQAPSSNYSVLFGALSGGVAYPQLYCTSSAMIAGDAMAFYTSPQAPSLDYVLCFSFSVEGGQKSTGVFNGVSATANNAFNYSATIPIHIFGRYQPSAENNNHTNLIATARFYSFSIYDNTSGVYLCDMVPVIRNSDNAVGMYDRVSNTFKGNANTSGPAFTYGKKLSVPSSYTEVSYIEQDAVTNLTGYAWTDTGVLPQAKMMIFGDIENLQYSASYNMAEFTGVVGASNSSALVVDSFDNQSTAIKMFRTYTASGNSYGIASTANNAFPINTKNPFISYADTSNDSIYMNGSFAQATSQYNNTLISNLSFYTFGHNANGSFSIWSSYRRSHTRIYNLGYMSDSGVIGYLIPSIRNSDGALGFYNAVNDTFYANQGTVPFTTDGTIYVVNSTSDFTTALTNAVSGDYVIITNDITIAQQDFAFASGVNIIQNDHTITPPTVTGYGIHSYWYTNSSYTGTTTQAITSGTHYYAKYLTEIAVSTLQELESAMTTATADNIIVLTADIDYGSETFTNTSLAVISKLNKLKAPARSTPWTFMGWSPLDPPNNVSPNATVHAVYWAYVTDETRLDIALETATQYDSIRLSNDITITSSNHPYGNVTGTTFTTKTFKTFYMNGHSITSTGHSNWSLGYSFVDWYSEKWTATLGTSAPATNTTYYARFEIDVSSGQYLNYAFTNAVDGDIVSLTQDVTMPNPSFTIPSYISFIQDGNTISPPSRNYYTAGNWTVDDSETVTTIFSAGHTYHGVYTPVTFAITYASNTQIPYTLPDDAITSYDYGTSATLPIPTADGYSFSGWYTNAQFSGQVKSSITTTDHQAFTLYAKWQEEPQSITIGNVNVYRNVGDITTGKSNNNADMLVIFTYNIEWREGQTPTTAVNQLFTFRLMDLDGTTTLATYTPYPYNNYGYGLGVGYFYFPDMVESNLYWQNEYQIRIDGNPFAWYSIGDMTSVRNIYASNYTNRQSVEENRQLLTDKLVNIAHSLENSWYTDETTPFALIQQTNNTSHLTSVGQAYFENSIAHLRTFAPDLFLTSVITPDYSEQVDPDNADRASLVARWQNQYEGTWVQSSLKSIGDLLHIPWRMATSILCLVLWIILSAISARMFGNTDAGFWSGAVMFSTMAMMGLMEYTIVGAGAILLALYSLYILLWRQG